MRESHRQARRDEADEFSRLSPIDAASKMLEKLEELSYAYEGRDLSEGVLDVVSESKMLETMSLCEAIRDRRIQAGCPVIRANLLDVIGSYGKDEDGTVHPSVMSIELTRLLRMAAHTGLSIAAPFPERRNLQDRSL